MIKNKKVNEGYSTDTTDIEGMLDAILDFIFVYSYEDACALGIIDEETSEFEEDAVDEFREDLINKNTKLAEYLYDIIDKLEPGERYDGKIDDILDYLEGYEVGDRLYPMATKNEAMERVNTSDFDKWCIKNVGPKVNAFIKELDNKIKSGKIDKDSLKDLNGLITYVAGEIFEIVTEAVKPYVEDNKKTNESLDESKREPELNDEYDWTNYLTRKLNLDEYYEDMLLHDLNNLRAGEWLDSLENSSKIPAKIVDKFKADFHITDYDDEDEDEADDDFTDGEAETDDNMNESLAGFKKLPVKTFERATNNSVPQTAELEDEVADESFAHDDSM